MDLALSLGDILTVASILGGGFIFLFRMEGKLNVLAVERKMERSETVTKFTMIEKQLEKVTECLLQLAEQKTRIQHLEEKIEDVVDMVRPKHPFVAKRKSAVKV